MAKELRNKKYCKWHHSLTDHTNECKVFRQQIQAAIDQRRLAFSRAPMKIDHNPFPINAIEKGEHSRANRGKEVADPEGDRPRANTAARAWQDKPAQSQ
jgi:hypothetical protein